MPRGARGGTQRNGRAVCNSLVMLGNGRAVCNSLVMLGLGLGVFCHAAAPLNLLLDGVFCFGPGAAHWASCSSDMLVVLGRPPRDRGIGAVGCGTVLPSMAATVLVGRAVTLANCWLWPKRYTVWVVGAVVGAGLGCVCERCCRTKHASKLACCLLTTNALVF